MPERKREATPQGQGSRWTSLVSLDAIPVFAKGPSALTLAATVLAQGLLVISGILVARTLGVEGRGTLAFLWLVPLALVLLGGIGIPQATTYFVAKDVDNAAAVVRISVRITLLVAAVLVVAYGAGLTAFGDVGSSYSRTDALMSMGLIPPLLALNLGIATLLGMKRFRGFNFTRLAGPFFYASGTATLFLLGDATLSAVLMVSLTSWVLGATVAWLMVLRDLPSSGERASAGEREIIGFGLRGVVGSTSTIDDVRADQLLVGLMMDPRALGLYVAAVAFCNLPRFVAQSLGSVAFPRIASAPDEAAAWTATVRAAKTGVLTIAATVGALLIVMPVLLPLLFGEDFRDAVSLGRILLVAAFFLSVHRLMTELARGLGHPGYGSITEVVNGFVFFLGVFILATPATTTGIAEAVLAGGIASSALLSLLLVLLRRRSGGGTSQSTDRPVRDKAEIARTRAAGR